MKRFLMTLVLITLILSGEAAAAQTRNSITQVFSDQGKGTGFFVTRNHVLTNHHVVCEENVICKGRVVIQYEGVKVRALIVDSDEDLDLALLFVKGFGPQPFEFCAGNIGDEIEQWAYEFGKFRERSGTINATWLKYIVSTIGLIAGNSGAPVLNNKGCVVGVTKSSLVSSGHAKHVNAFFAKSFLDSYLAMESLR